MRAGDRVNEQDTTSQTMIRRRNRTAALQLVLSGDGTATRASIVRSTGLTSATVSSILAELIDDGLVTEGSRAESTGGKRATMLRIDETRHAVLAIAVSPGLLRAATLDLRGRVRAAATVRPRRPVRPADVQRLAARMVRESSARVIAIGVQVPGITEGELVRWSVQLGWTDVDLVRALAEVVEAPAFLINDADAEALAETSASEPDVAQLYVSLSAGVGASFIVDGRLLRGAAGRVGEIGHVPVIFGPDAPPCPCGGHGCLEELVSVTAMLGLPHGAELESLDLARLAGSAEAQERIDAGAQALARVLLPIAAAVDVPNVVIGGYAPRMGARFLGQVRAEAARYPVAGAMPLSLRYAGPWAAVPFRGTGQHALYSVLGIGWGA